MYWVEAGELINRGMDAMAVYALAEMVDDAATVLEFENEAIAAWQFKRLCARSSRLRWPSIVSMWLFESADDATAAIVPDPLEIQVDESRAVKVLEWERPYGLHGFSVRAPETLEVRWLGNREQGDRPRRLRDVPSLCGRQGEPRRL